MGTDQAMTAKRKYPEELLERGARMVFDAGRPIAHVARDLGIHHEALRKWVRRAEASRLRESAESSRKLWCNSLSFACSSSEAWWRMPMSERARSGS